MDNISILQTYLKALYDAYELFQAKYHSLHKRSTMHKKETVAEYYLRWRDKMRAEIRRVEGLLIKLLPNTELRAKSSERRVEKIHLQIVAISETFAFSY